MWTPVSDCLPEKYGRYLTTIAWPGTKYSMVKELYFGESGIPTISKSDEVTWLELDDGEFIPLKIFSGGEVIAWMPLPEKYIPKEDK
jgi:hypothetical protein